MLETLARTNPQEITPITISGRRADCKHFRFVEKRVSSTVGRGSILEHGDRYILPQQGSISDIQEGQRIIKNNIRSANGSIL